jgi:hypothetical protein
MMARPKPKVPIYPRPVSPLRAESYPVEPQDVIYASSWPSSDDDASTRAAKRLRIEKLGEQYLRGDGLHILSAGLKGPFGPGWKNPWAKRERRAKREVVEIPETAGKPIKKLPVKNGGTKVKSSKVEEWLRRNSAFSGIELAEETSPTPPCAKLVDLKDERLVRQDMQPKMTPGRAEAHATIRSTDCPDSDQRKDNPASTRLPPATKQEPQAQILDNAPNERRVWISHAANADRAEFAALKSKRRALQVAPASTMLSPFEYRRVSGETQRPKKFEEVARPSQSQTGPVSAKVEEKRPGLSAEREDPIEMADGTDVAREDVKTAQVVATSASVAVPALSTETSRASIANLPSAQPQSLAVPAPSTTDLAIDEGILEQPREATNSIEAPKRAQPFSEATPMHPNKQVNNQESTAMSSTNRTPQVPNKANTDNRKTHLPKGIARGHSSPNTQSMLAEMSPLAYSTIKQTKVDARRRETPVTATKRRPEKLAKLTTLPAGERVSSNSSQGSLKMSLRVSKGSSSTPAGKENTAIRIDDEESDMLSPDMFAIPALESQVPGSSPKRLKSALKPSGLPPSTAPFPSTKGSTSTGIDGGQNVHVPEVEDNTFDLDGAIDDLGSYLGTWDAEKEASGLAIDT